MESSLLFGVVKSITVSSCHNLSWCAQKMDMLTSFAPKTTPKTTLLHHKVKPKAVTCYANESNPSWCLVPYFQTYLKHRPADCSVFYLTPLRKIKDDIWYSKMPVGHNTLSGTVARVCKQAFQASKLTIHFE